MSENATKSKIYYFPRNPSGCFWYRIQQPMEMLANNGVETVLTPINTDVDDDFTAVQFYGAAPFSCRRVFEHMKENGKRIVYDMDDALGLIDTSNPFYHAIRRDIGSMNESLLYADEVTVSCPALKEYVSTIYKGPITIVPNCYTPSEWTYPRPKREGIRIGFAGSVTHVKDLIDIIPVIKKLKEKYPEIIFFIMGFGQSDYQTWYKQYRYSASGEALEDLNKLDYNLAQLGEFQWVPFVDFDKYPTSLINMSLDIGICPLKETPFDRCRTACKAMEYTLSGALALASDTTPYREDKSSVLVKDGEWEAYLDFYIRHPEIRETVRKSHLDWIHKNRKNTCNLDILKKVYNVV